MLVMKLGQYTVTIMANIKVSKLVTEVEQSTADVEEPIKDIEVGEQIIVARTTVKDIGVSAMANMEIAILVDCTGSIVAIGKYFIAHLDAILELAVGFSFRISFRVGMAKLIPKLRGSLVFVLVFPFLKISLDGF